MKVRFFNPGLTYKTKKKEFDKEIQRVLTNGDLVLRDDVEKFEKNLAKFIGVKYAVSLNSGTDALYLALKALGIGRDDEVLVPSRTFVATAQVVVQVGAKPVFYDLNGKLKVTKKTKAIIPVHIEGAIDTNMDNIISTAIKYGLYIVEDAAQAFGAKFGGVKAGNIGTVGCFSFYPAKILGAFGDAGGLVTDDEKIYEYVREARNHFKTDSSQWGINSRLDNIQAAILNVRFKDIKNMLKRREQIAKKYDKGLNQLADLTLPPNVCGRVWQDYIVRTPRRDDLHKFLKDNGVETLKNNYPFPVPKLPLAQAYENETLRLPCNENLKDNEVEYVIKMINKYFEQGYCKLGKSHCDHCGYCEQ